MCAVSLMLLAEDNLASKVGGEENLEQLQYLKGLLDPENLFRNHQLRGLTPDFQVAYGRKEAIQLAVSGVPLLAHKPSQSPFRDIIVHSWLFHWLGLFGPGKAHGLMQNPCTNMRYG